jgi:hypothetical protein
MTQNKGSVAEVLWKLHKVKHTYIPEGCWRRLVTEHTSISRRRENKKWFSGSLAVLFPPTQPERRNAGRWIHLERLLESVLQYKKKFTFWVLLPHSKVPKRDYLKNFSQVQNTKKGEIQKKKLQTMLSQNINTFFLSRSWQIRIGRRGRDPQEAPFEIMGDAHNEKRGTSRWEKKNRNSGLKKKSMAASCEQRVSLFFNWSLITKFLKRRGPSCS